MLISDTMYGLPQLRRSTVAYRSLQYFCVFGADHSKMDEMEKYKQFCICWCKPLEDHWASLKKEVCVTRATFQKVQKVTEHVETRTHFATYAVADQGVAMGAIVSSFV